MPSGPDLPLLILITDWELPRGRLMASLESVLALGPDVAVQHRHPGATDRAFFEEGEQLARLCLRFGNGLFVNGRLDVALLLGAHLHLPSRGIEVADVRPHLPTGRWISAAVHDADEAQEAAGADIALVSPVFSPGSKATRARAPLGPEGFARLAERLGGPAFALGGVDPSNANQIRGASGFAAISAVLRAAQPRLAAQELLAAARRSRSSRRRDDFQSGIG